MSHERDDQILSFAGVTVELSGRMILDNVSFTIHQGEFMGLLGPNGAGKTTILRTILGLQPLKTGSLVRTHGTSHPDETTFGYVPQKVLIDPDLPLRSRDLVALGIDGQKYGIPFPSKHRKDLVLEMLDAVDAAQFADVRVGSLSGGELQRVLIAHALVGKPRLVLLDEPLANLDMRSEGEIVSLLSSIVKEQGITVLVSAHDVNALLPAMDHVVYVAGGHVASGSTREVIREDVLSTLYGHHVDVIHIKDRILVVAGPQGHDEGFHHG